MADLKLRELHILGGMLHLESLKEKINILAKSSKIVHLEGNSNINLNRKGESNITTLKITNTFANDVSDEILRNLEQAEGHFLLSDEKFTLLFHNKKLHTFKGPNEFEDNFVVANITNNQTLKNINIGIEKEEYYFKLACNQVKIFDTFIMGICGWPT